MRVVGTDKEITATGAYWSAPNYATFWGGGFYGWGYGGMYSPGYVRTDTVVAVETLVYSLDQDKLVWAGMSQTTNPKDVGRLVHELSEKVARELRKQKLIR